MILCTVFTKGSFILAGALALCMPHAQLLDHYRIKFNEQPIYRALENGGNIMEILVSKDGRSWTQITTGPNGWSCAKNAGTYFEVIGNRHKGDHT